MTLPIHHDLADRELLPAEHLMDAGYPCASHILTCRTDYEVRLVTPVHADRSHQARAKTGFHRDAFTINFDRKQAVCPQHRVSTMWNEARYAGEDVVVVTFPASTCIPCPVPEHGAPPQNNAGDNSPSGPDTYTRPYNRPGPSRPPTNGRPVTVPAPVSKAPSVKPWL